MSASVRVRATVTVDELLSGAVGKSEPITAAKCRGLSEEPV